LTDFWWDHWLVDLIELLLL